jgi:Holliday junction resolvase RusA-like endonuclease
MQQIKFTIFGNPKSWKRHKTAMTKSGYVRHYDPGEIDKSNFLAKAMEHRPKEPLKNPLILTLFFNIARPKSHYRTGKNAGKLKDSAPISCTTRPDLDNYVKFVLDALNGVFWIDDAQVFSLYASKTYSSNPSVLVSIVEIENDEELNKHLTEKGYKL